MHPGRRAALLDSPPASKRLVMRSGSRREPLGCLTRSAPRAQEKGRGRALNGKALEELEKHRDLSRTFCARCSTLEASVFKDLCGQTAEHEDLIATDARGCFRRTQTTCLAVAELEERMGKMARIQGGRHGYVLRQPVQIWLGCSKGLDLTAECLL